MRTPTPILVAVALGCTAQVPPEPAPPGHTPVGSQAGDLRDEPFEGTVGTTRVERASGVATVGEVRTGTHDAYDRFVFELTGPAVPGYHVEYVDRPQHRCGSGEPVHLDGDAWLAVRLTPARMHTDAGAATVAERTRVLGYDNLLVAESTCDFEGRVEWILALRSPQPYRVIELVDPPRIFVDVLHPPAAEAASR